MIRLWAVRLISWVEQVIADVEELEAHRSGPRNVLQMTSAHAFHMPKSASLPRNAVTIRLAKIGRAGGPVIYIYTYIYLLKPLDVSLLEKHFNIELVSAEELSLLDKLAAYLPCS